MDLPQITHERIDIIQNILKKYLETNTNTILYKNNVYHIKEYFKEEFTQLRNFYNITNAILINNINKYYYINDSINLNHSLTFYSGTFCLTIKVIKKREKETFSTMFKDYFLHVMNNPGSLLSKIYGCYRIQSTNNVCVYLLMMDNILPSNQKYNEIYDLKGSMHNRKSFVGSRILKDQDWIINRKKLYLDNSRINLLRNVKKDADFLKKFNIIDYSFIIAVNNHRCNFLPRKFCERYSEGVYCDNPSLIYEINNEDDIFHCERYEYCSEFDSVPETYYVGIIDFLTSWSRKKKIENFICESLCCRTNISCVKPDEYSKRFVEFFENVVLLGDDEIYFFN